jgi:AcrR family transcriptional regulator
MKNKNTGKRQERAIETKKKIYEAAKQLFLVHGVENVSVDSIVEAAGVSKGAFYVHFKSKDLLFATLVNDYTNIADLDYKSFLLAISDNKSTFDILHNLAEEISDFIEHSIGLENMRTLYKAHLSKTIDTTSAISYNRELYKTFSEVLERGVNKGEIREDIAVDLLAKHLILAIRGITFECCIRYPDMNLKEEVLNHFNILLYGLKK